tara:strand:+ start:4934 stop:5278 length:345 start_codon:yes stop_codon:yes gene_type:complete
VCSHLIGRSYSYGQNDCIHLVIDALDQIGIENPGVKKAWYTMTPRQVLRELNHYCERLDCPSYDGDIALLGVRPLAFGVLWQNGVLYINNSLSAVDWKPVDKVLIRRSYRTKGR